MPRYPLLTLVFVAVVGGMTLLELLVVHRRPREMRLREAFGWCLVWAGLAALFAGGLWLLHGRERALQFAAGYLLEQSLSVDNMFVFILIFRYFGTPLHDQARVLHWGILGAIVMRMGFIAAGVQLIQRLHWMTFVFGGLLLFTAAKMAFEEEASVDPGRNPALRLLKRFVPVLAEDRGDAFFALEKGVLYATPLLAALLVVEFSDLVFALDSIPAVIGVTRDPFIVYTSNIFAIMGLRALYFLLNRLLGGLRFLRAGISAILAFVGLKMVLSPWLDVSILVSLSVIAGVLALSVAASLLRPAIEK